MQRYTKLLLTFLVLIGNLSYLHAQQAPINQLSLAKPEAGARYGNITATDQTRLLVTAPYAQAAFVYRLENGQWHQEADLLGINRLADFDAAKGFGLSAAIDQNFAAVGAPESSQGASCAQGQIQLYTLVGKKWKIDRILQPEVTSPGASFGQVVSLKGNLLVTGAPGFGERAGRGYIYENQAGNWVETLLELPGAGHGSKFGTSVALFDQMAAISAPGWKVNGDPLGTLVIYTKNETGKWAISQQLASPDGIWFFGRSLAMTESLLAVGARDRVFIYEKIGDQWKPLFTVVNPSPEFSLDFAKDLQLSPDNQFLSIGGDGMAYLFQRSEMLWNVAATYRNISSGGFGSSNVFVNNQVLINAPWERVEGIKSGSVLFYELPVIEQAPVIK